MATLRRMVSTGWKPGGHIYNYRVVMAELMVSGRTKSALKHDGRQLHGIVHRSLSARPSILWQFLDVP